MTEIHTVTQTEKEYHDYHKKKDREKLEGGILGVIIFLAGMSGICALLGYFK